MNTHTNTLTNKDDFMSFFRDEKKIQLLTQEDKAEIAKHILASTANLNKSELEEIWNDYSSAIHQLVEQKNSLPVF